MLHHLAGRSKSTYDAGLGAFVEYATQLGLPTDVFTLPVAEVQAVMEGFVLWMRRANRAPATITQYVSHVSEYLKVRGIPTPLRGVGMAVLLECITRQETSAAPARLTQKIPVTCALMLLILRRCDDAHAGDTLAQCKKRAMAKAVCAFTYGMCLRIHEVLSDGRTVDRDGLAIADHAVRTAHVGFMFAGDPTLYPATDPAAFPVAKRPTAFAAFHDSCKNWASGTGTRNVRANPLPFPFCCVGLVFDYVVAFPPPRGGHLFPGLRDTVVSALVKWALDSVGLDGARGCCHAIRVGSESMAIAMRHSVTTVSGAQAQEHGLWRSEQGLKPYARASFGSGGDLSAALYDISYMPIDYLLWYYMSPAIKVADNGVTT